MGAKNEFRRTLEEMGHDAIQRYLSAYFSADWGIYWKQNPPPASHMGEFWECQIQLVPFILLSLI